MRQKMGSARIPETKVPAWAGEECWVAASRYAAVAAPPWLDPLGSPVIKASYLDFKYGVIYV